MSDAPEFITAGVGETLILIHGLGFDAHYWQPQMEAFSPYFQTIAWNMPGYGGTPPLANMTFAGLSAALADLMDRKHIAKAHILGHSMGGMVALDFAASHAERIKSLILFAASAAFPPPDSDFAKAFIRARLAPLEAGGGMKAVANEMASQHFGPRANAEGVAIAKASLRNCPPATYRQSLNCLTCFDRRAALEELTVPTLVIACEADINAPAKGVEKMAAKIPSAAFRLLPHLGHLANLEAPTLFNKSVLEFLQHLNPASDAAPLQR